MMIPRALVLGLLTACAAVARCDDPAPKSLAELPIQQVSIDDEFWSPKLNIWRTVTIPDCLGKFERDRGGAFNNFDLVRDGKRGFHAGPEWYDGLIYEM